MVTSSYRDCDIAIIGMSGRFPGAANLEQFWNNLVTGRESIRFFSDEELANAGIPATTFQSPHYVKACGYLDHADTFDAAFFGISPREAEIIDPQHRLFLECCWHGLENAGYDPHHSSHSIGVYAGMGKNFYLWYQLLPQFNFIKNIGTYSVMVGNEKDFLSTRIAYKLNLQGPAVTVQTACSTSLAAVHLACQALLSYECDMALAGGVTVRVPLISGYFSTPDSITSPDGHCRAFDAKANGMVPGSGVGVVVLKRMKDALRDHDQIRAVIKGTAMNNDGSQKLGFTAPSVAGQKQVITQAFTMAELSPDSIGYIEAHGTGTALGDPMEIEAATQAFRMKTARVQFCGIGSVKTNIGHLDAAAGITGLIKTVLALEHQILPASLHFTSPNEQCHLEQSPFFVVSKTQNWLAMKNGDHCMPLRAGVTSLGIGGTNVHIILEQAPVVSEQFAQYVPTIEEDSLLTLSAKSPQALSVMTQAWQTHFLSDRHTPWPCICYTQNIRQPSWPYRLAVVAKNLTQLPMMIEEALQATATIPPWTNTSNANTASSIPPLYITLSLKPISDQFLLQLFQRFPSFLQFWQECAKIVQSLTGYTFSDIGIAQEKQTSYANIPGYMRISDQETAQEVKHWISTYALAKLWYHWGILPHGWIGHQWCEWMAACLSEMVALPDALLIAILSAKYRGQQKQKSSAADAVQHHSHDNQAPNTALGLHDEATGMPSWIDQIGEKIASLHFENPKVPILSNLSGFWLDPKEASNPTYWCSQIIYPSRLENGIQTLQQEKPASIWLDVNTSEIQGISPQPTLTPPSSPQQPSKYDIKILLSSLGKLWQAGYNIHWEQFYQGQSWHRSTALPAYPFQCQRYWAEPRQSSIAHLSADTPQQPSTPANDSTSPQTQDFSMSPPISAIANGPLPSLPGKNLGVTTTPDISNMKQQYTMGHGHAAIPMATLDTLVESHEEETQDHSWFYAPVWQQNIITKFSHHGMKNCMIIADILPANLKTAAEQAGVVLKHIQPNANFPAIFKSWPADVILDAILLLVVPVQNLSLETLTNFSEILAQQFVDASLRLLQTLEAFPKLHLDKIVWLCPQLWNIQDNDPVVPEQGWFAGFVRCARKEYPKWNLLCIDPGSTIAQYNLQANIAAYNPCTTLVTGGIADTVAAYSAEQWTMLLVHIQREPKNNGYDIAYRWTRRWLRTWQPVSLPPPSIISSPASSKTIAPSLAKFVSPRHETISSPSTSWPTSSVHLKPLPITKEGVYLITGGLGGIGMTLAEFLAKNYHAKLALVSRRKLPDRSLWPQIVQSFSKNNAKPSLSPNNFAHKSRQEADATLIQKILELEQYGAMVQVFSADVSNLAEFQEVLCKIWESWKRIHGIIHAAGVSDGSLIAGQTWENCRAVMAAKVQGLRTINFLNDWPLVSDWIVLCSSLTTLLGTVGQSAYAAANAVFDAASQFFAILGMKKCPLITIHWDTWKEVGMAVETKVPGRFAEFRHQALMQYGITREEAIQAFCSILQSGLTNVIVSPHRNFKLSLQPVHAEKTTAPTTSSKKDVDSSSSLRPRPPYMQNPWEAPQNDTEKALAEIWQQILGFQGIGRQDHFLELGGDSLLAIQILAQANTQLNITCSLSAFLQNPTIAYLASQKQEK